MKKRFFLMVAVSLLVLALSGCGGSGSAEKASANGGSNSQPNTLTEPTTPTTPTTNPNTPSVPTQPGDTAQTPTTLVLAPVPADELMEAVNVAVNQSYASSHVDTDARAAEMVAHINALFAKTTRKRFRLNQVLVYPDDQLGSIAKNPSYFKDNGYVGNPNWGGITFVDWVQDGPLTQESLPQLFKDLGGGTGYAVQTTIGGKTYGIIYWAEMAEGSVLLGRDKLPAYVNGLNSYDKTVAGISHELGHLHGLGAPEWYPLEFSDQSGTLPNLGNYSLPARYPEDPMSGADVVKYDIRDFQFSPLNSWLIDHNANHQLNPWQIADAVKAMKVKVKVVDALGNPVAGAEVTVYGGVEVLNGAWGIARNMASQLEAPVTDANGSADLANDFNVRWHAKGVKASAGGKAGGAVVSTQDLVDAYWRQGITDAYAVTILLK